MSVKTKVNGQWVVHSGGALNAVLYAEQQSLDASEKNTARTNIGIYTGDDTPVNAHEGDIWIGGADGAPSSGSSGGSVSGSALELDPTLSVEGAAADAKAVGEMKDAIEQRLESVEEGGTDLLKRVGNVEADLSSRVNNVYTLNIQTQEEMESLDFSKYKAGDVLLVILPEGYSA